MSQNTLVGKFSILIADDDADDRELLKAAFDENSFIIKPVTFKKLVEFTQTLWRYWFEFVELPNMQT